MLRIFYEDCDKNAIDAVVQELKSGYSPTEGEHIIITPSSYSFSIETLVLKSLGIKGAFNIAFGSFERICSESLKKYDKKILSREGAIMVLRKVINANYKKLNQYSKSSKNPSFAGDMYKAIESLRLSGLSPSDVKKALSNIKGSTKLKLTDIVLLYEAYIEEISKSTPDLIHVYDSFINNIKNEEQIKNSNVYILGFNTLTNKEMQIIKAISNHAKKTIIGLSFVQGDLVNEFTTPDKTSVRLLEIVGKDNVKTFVRGAEKENVDDEKNKVSLCSNVFDFLRHELFGYSDKIFPVNDNSIEVYAEDNVFTEINAVASEIIELVRKHGLRYKDITIFNALPENNFNIKEIFNRYNIPVYIPDKTTLDDSLIFTYLLSILEFARNPRDMKRALEYIKNPLFFDDFEQVCNFENYIYAKNISYKDFSKPFKDENGKNIFEELRKLVHNRLSYFVNTPIPSKVEDFVNICIEIIKDINMHKRFTKILDNKPDEELNINQRSVDALADILLEIKTILSGESINLIDFIAILTSGAKATTLASIPQDLDCVIVGEIGKSKLYGNKIAFVIGFTNDSILDVINDDRILNSYDNKAMEGNNIAIYPLASDKIKNNRYELIEILAKYDRFYFSYPLFSNKGEKTEPSVALEEIKRLLNKKEYSSLMKKHHVSSFIQKQFSESDLKTFLATSENAFFQWLQLQSYPVDEKDIDAYMNLLGEIYKYIDVDKRALIDSILNLCNGSNVSKINDLLDKAIKTSKIGEYQSSVSQFESYFTCPYKHFMQYAIKATRRPEGLVLPVTIGSIVHHALELFFEDTMNQLDSIDEKTIELQINKNIDDAYSEYNADDLSRNLINKYLLDRLREEIVQKTKLLVEQVKKGDYRPNKIELEFGFNPSQSTLEIPVTKTVNGKESPAKLQFRGKIDRVDITNYKDRQNYYSIIDYKTGSPSFSMGEVYKGTTIQLITYLFALKLNKKYAQLEPGYLAYLKLQDSYDDKGSGYNTTSGMYLGLLNTRKESLLAFDKDIFNRAKLSVPEFEINTLAKKTYGSFPKTDKGQERLKEFNSEGYKYKRYELNQIESEVYYYTNSSKIITVSGLDVLTEYIKILIAIAFKEIEAGNIARAPSKNDKCEYCDYYPICSIGSDYNERPSLDTIKIDNIAKAVENFHKKEEEEICPTIEKTD